MGSAEQGDYLGFSGQPGEDRPGSLFAQCPNRLRTKTTLAIKEAFVELEREGTVEVEIHLEGAPSFGAIARGMLIEVLRKARENAQYLGQEAKVVLRDPTPEISDDLEECRLIEHSALVIEHTPKQTQ